MDRFLLDGSTTDPNILGGKPVVRVMRVNVEQIVKPPAAGAPEGDLLADIPVLEREDLRSCLSNETQTMGEYSHFAMA